MPERLVVDIVGFAPAQAWGRATSPQDLPSVEWALAFLGLAVITVGAPVVGAWVGYAVTVIHEAGHAAVALLVGRRLKGIRLHRDHSGVTTTHGRSRGPGMVATVLAGYPAPTVVGLLGVLLLSFGYAALTLWSFVVLCVLVGLWVRNVHGVVVVLGLAGSMAAAAWGLPSTAVVAIAHVVVWMLLLRSPLAVLNMVRTRSLHRRRAGASERTSDAAMLHQLTGVPGGVWSAAFLSVASGGLAAAVFGLLRL